MSVRCFAALCVLAVAPAVRAESPTPVLLPRALFVGSFVRRETVTPAARLQWAATLVQDRIDAFVLVVEAGAAWGYRLAREAGPEGDARMGSFYEHTATAGLGYRSTRPSGFHWGFHLVTGPVLYGAHYDAGPGSEQRIAGLLDARAQMGVTVGGVAVGVSAGYAEPYSYPKRSVAGPYLGGVLLGLFADWR